MHEVVRRYTGSPQAADELERRRRKVEEVIGGVPGFAAYHLLRTVDGIASVTVCRDRAGTEQSSRLAAAWVRDNPAAGSVNRPEITEGEAIVHLAK